MSELDAVLGRAEEDLEPALKRLMAWLKIPSISTDPAYREHCREAADWLVADLAGIGFDVQAHKTDGHPIVMGKQGGAAEASVLFYGHYDVQPVDPVDLWDHEPFAPFVETRPDGRRTIRGRGASDDKGQVMTFVEACRAWHTVTGKLPTAVKVLIEGEEESGGVHLPPFMKKHADALKADIGLICDTTMWDPETPAITTMLRGMCAEEFTVTAADRDLHSGHFGSAAANPNHIVARILADLRDEYGRITLPGFYDGVPELPTSLREQWAKLDFSADAFLGGVGLSKPAGEQDRTALEQLWARPTCEVNGMGGGYQGSGFKTVIPAKASAKVSFRLVFDQDPQAIKKSFREFVRARVPDDCDVAFINHGSGRATAFDIGNPIYEKARRALTDEWQKEAVFIGAGGSIPVGRLYKDILSMDVILAGFALEDDRIHSPNEKYDLESFRRGIRSWVRILHALGET